MAIVSGFIQSKYRKSIGNVTYAMLGGDIIAREKITTNTSNTALQASQRSLFKQCMSFIRWLNPYANIAYRRNGRRSAYAEFTKRMYPGVASLLAANEDALEPDYFSFLTAAKKSNELTGGETPAIQGDFRPVSIRFSNFVPGTDVGMAIGFGAVRVNMVLDKVPESLKIGEVTGYNDANKSGLVTATLLRPETNENGTLVVAENDGVGPNNYNNTYRVSVLPSGLVDVEFSIAPITQFAKVDDSFANDVVGAYFVPLIRVPGLGVARISLSDLGVTV